jgi:hypothetical protein
MAGGWPPTSPVAAAASEVAVTAAAPPRPPRTSAHMVGDHSCNSGRCAFLSTTRRALTRSW